MMVPHHHTAVRRSREDTAGQIGYEDTRYQDGFLLLSRNHSKI